MTKISRTSSRKGLSTRCLLSAMALLTLFTSCQSSDSTSTKGNLSPEDDGPVLIVTTHAPLGALIRETVGPDIGVDVLIPNGRDPREHFPDNGDLRKLEIADLVVLTGGNLEPHFAGGIEKREKAGQPVFVAIEHLPRQFLNASFQQQTPTTIVGETATTAPSPPPADPYFWLDPRAAAEFSLALGRKLSTLNIEVSARAEKFTQELQQLYEEGKKRAGLVPGDKRKIISSEENFGWFAKAFGFEFLGAAEASTPTRFDAGHLDKFVTMIRNEKIPVFFTDPGQSETIVNAVINSTDARRVEVQIRSLPQDNRYTSYMTNIIGTITDALASTPAETS